MSEHVAAGNVTAGDVRTANAGAELLRGGGNAVDAAVGATFAAFACEPVLTAPFGGGFALVGGPQQPATAYDFFADIPGRNLPPAKDVPELDFRGLEVSFGPTTQVFHAGRGAAAAPLLLPGLLKLHADHGRLPLAAVLAPAIALAQAGVPLSAQVAPIANILTPILTLMPDTAKLFAPHEGRVLRAGEVFRSPHLATLLQRVAQGDTGWIEPALLANFGPPGGRLTAADLAAAQVAQHVPLQVNVGRHTVALNPPPSLGGLLVGFGLKLLNRVPKDVWNDETETFCYLLACMAVTQAARSQILDPAARQGSAALNGLTEAFLSDGFIDSWHEPFMQAAREGPPTAGFASRSLGSTTHVSSIDADGMACCITSSNGEGCGHLVPNAGVMANNFLGEEDINPGGFHVRPGGERLTSMMCPTLVSLDGRPTLALGTGGSNRIRTALLQVLAHHLLRQTDLDTAVKMPRLHYEGGPLFVERRVLGMAISDTTLNTLAARVPQVVYFDAPNMFFGGVHVASIDGAGVGDARRGGAVALANQ